MWHKAKLGVKFLWPDRQYRHVRRSYLNTWSQVGDSLIIRRMAEVTSVCAQVGNSSRLQSPDQNQKHMLLHSERKKYINKQILNFNPVHKLNQNIDSQFTVETSLIH